METIKTWQERLEAHNSTNPVFKKKRGLLWDAPDAMRAEIADLRAALAAAPAQSEAPDERAALEVARNAAYPVPDSSHSSVNMRAVADRTAFTRGWQAHARLAPAAAQQDAQDAARATDPVVEANCELLRRRSKVGIVKYGVTLAGANLSESALLQHALEEALDLSNYLQAVLQKSVAAERAAIAAMKGE